MTEPSHVSPDYATMRRAIRDSNEAHAALDAEWIEPLCEADVGDLEAA